MPREVLLSFRLQNLLAAEKSSRKVLAEVRRSKDLSDEVKRDMTRTIRAQLNEAKALRKRASLEARAADVGSGGVFAGSAALTAAKSRLDAVRETAEKVMALRGAALESPAALLSGAVGRALPGVAIVAAVVQPIVAKLREELERRMDLQAERLAAAFEADMIRFRRELDYVARLERDPAFREREAKRLGEQFDVEERARAASGATPVNFLDRF